MRIALLTSAGGVVAEVLAAPALPDSGREVALSGCDVEFDHVWFGYADPDSEAAVQRA